MTIQDPTLTDSETKAIICLCIFAALADGAQDEFERAQIERIVQHFSNSAPDLASAYQDVIGGKITIAQATAQLQSPAAKTLAYEMAVCVCHADGQVKESERQFLTSLAQALQLDAAAADTHQQSAQALGAQPFNTSPPPVINTGNEAEIDRLILNAAIFNGALEIMPHTLATMAIIPLQMRMVYQIGKASGFELDRGHITDFLATVGIGLTSQVFEGFTERLIGGFARGVAGRFLGGLIGQASGSAVAFASTYALGQVAKHYYASGRTLSAAQLKETFSTMLNDARSRQGRYSADIAQKAREVNMSELLPLLRR